MTVRVYSAYRDSGLSWLSQVPAHWELRPPKHYIKTQAGGTLIKGDCSPEHVDGLFPGYSASGQDVWLTEYRYNAPGLVLSAVGARCGKVFKADGTWGVVANTACLLPRLNADRDFLWHLTNNEDWWEKGGTAQPYVRLSETMARCWAFPPLNEQAAIAAFLDRETGKIDALVAEQERLIALLKEKRQAVISHTVTKGLNPDVPMKDSGVPWLGKVPAHWQGIQLGRVCREISDGPHFSPKYVDPDNGVMFLSARNIQVDKWSLDDAKFVSMEDYKEFCKRIAPTAGDILYTKGGTTGIARVVDLKFDFQVWVHVAVLKLYSEIADPYYVAYALNSASGYEQSQLHTRGATNQDLGLTRMVGIWLALPPLTEQQSVASFLRDQIAELNDLSSEASHAITLLRERRAALISAAVTGKIDVRDTVTATRVAA